MLLNGYNITIPKVEKVSYLSIEESSIERNSYQEVADASIFLFNSYFNSLIESDMSILTEGSNGFVRSILNFFKNLWNKFTNFIKKIINWFRVQFMDFTDYLKEHKNDLHVSEPYTVDGYEYTIDEGNINFSPVDDILNKVNADAKKMEHCTNEEYTEILRSGITGKDLSIIRGRLIGMNEPIDQGDFAAKINESLRGGASYTTMITINDERLREFADKYIQLHSLYKKLLVEEGSMKSMFSKIKYFFEHMPSTKIENGEKKIAVADISRDEFELNKENEYMKYTSNFNSRLVGYYQKQADMCKELARIYTTYYSTKLKTLVEAEKFYKKHLRRNISIFSQSTKDKIEKKSKESGGSK